MEPSNRFTSNECQEFLRATQLLSLQHQQLYANSVAAGTGAIGGATGRGGAASGQGGQGATAGPDGAVGTQGAALRGGGQRRSYKLWSPYEQFTLQIGVALYGAKNYGKLASLLENRPEKKVSVYRFFA